MGQNWKVFWAKSLRGRDHTENDAQLLQEKVLSSSVAARCHDHIEVAEDGLLKRLSWSRLWLQPYWKYVDTVIRGCDHAEILLHRILLNLLCGHDHKVLWSRP